MAAAASGAREVACVSKGIGRTGTRYQVPATARAITHSATGVAAKDIGGKRDRCFSTADCQCRIKWTRSSSNLAISQNYNAIVAGLRHGPLVHPCTLTRLHQPAADHPRTTAAVLHPPLRHSQPPGGKRPAMLAVFQLQVTDICSRRLSPSRPVKCFAASPRRPAALGHKPHLRIAKHRYSTPTDSQDLGSQLGRHGEPLRLTMNRMPV